MSHRSRAFHGGRTADLPERERRRRSNRRRQGEKTYLVTITLKGGRRPVVVGNVNAEDCEALRRAHKNRAKLKKADRSVRLTDQVFGDEVTVDVGKIALFDIE